MIKGFTEIFACSRDVLPRKEYHTLEYMLRMTDYLKNILILLLFF